MKTINTIYIVAIGLVVILILLFARLKNDSAFFYGFSENKETAISLGRDVVIEKILITTGERVKKGDLLMVVKNTLIPRKISELELKKEALNINSQQDINAIKNKISSLRISKINKVSEIESKINSLNKEIELHKLLYSGLKSIPGNTNEMESKEQIELKYLEGKLVSISDAYNHEIAYNQNLLNEINEPTEIEKEILNNEIGRYKSEEEKMNIYAPSDGIVGSINCKEEENISAFSTLMGFYQMNPTLVKGFVHESLLLQVKIGDDFEVISSMHPEHKVMGNVIGLGSRIVEIPQRLRKIPDFKTYGREVMIEIPADNMFLQKERVMLQSN